MRDDCSLLHVAPQFFERDARIGIATEVLDARIEQRIFVRVHSTDNQSVPNGTHLRAIMDEFPLTDANPAHSHQ